MKKIFLTGGAGYVGTELAEELVELDMKLQYLI